MSNNCEQFFQKEGSLLYTPIDKTISSGPYDATGCNSECATIEPLPCCKRLGIMINQGETKRYMATIKQTVVGNFITHASDDTQATGNYIRESSETINASQTTINHNYMVFNMSGVQNNLVDATINVGEFPIEITGITIDITNKTFSVGGICYSSCGMPTEDCQQSGNWNASGSLVLSDTGNGSFSYSLPSSVSEYLSISGTISEGGSGTWSCGSDGTNNPSSSEITAFSYNYVFNSWEGDSSGHWYDNNCTCTSTGNGTEINCTSEWGACSQITSFGFYSPGCSPTSENLNITHTVDASCVSNIYNKDGYSCDENGGRTAGCYTRSTSISNTLSGIDAEPPAIIYGTSFAPSIATFKQCDASNNCTEVGDCDTAMSYLVGCQNTWVVQKATITNTLNYTQTYNLTLSLEE